MVKGNIIIQMEVLDMKVNLTTENMKELGNILMKMVVILLVNGKTV